MEDGQDYAIWSITVPLTREDVGVKVWLASLAYILEDNDVSSDGDMRVPAGELC